MGFCGEWGWASRKTKDSHPRAGAGAGKEHWMAGPASFSAFTKFEIALK